MVPGLIPDSRKSVSLKSTHIFLHLTKVICITDPGMCESYGEDIVEENILLAPVSSGLIVEAIS